MFYLLNKKQLYQECKRLRHDNMRLQLFQDDNLIKENNKLSNAIINVKEMLKNKEEEDEEVVELEVTFTWSAEQEGEYQEVHKEVILLDLTDYMEEYLAYKSDPEAIPEMSDWIEGLCGYPGYDGDGDLEQTWVEK